MHDEKRALLAAIIAHPDEDTPRLVYADWLQEHDQPERAEFIRVQIAYARLRYGSPEYERDGAELQRRSFDLDREFERTWKAALDLPPPNSQNRYWFRRGMIGYVWCSGRYFLDHAAELFATVPVECFTFRRLSLSNLNMLVRSPHIRRVRGLNFLLDETQPVTIAAYLQQVPTCGLRVLEFTSLTVSDLSPTWTARNVWLGQALAQTPDLAELQYLNLRRAGVGGEGAQALIESPHLTGLTHLNLEGNGIDDLTEAALRRRFGNAVNLGQSDYARFTMAELGWN